MTSSLRQNRYDCLKTITRFYISLPYVGTKIIFKNFEMNSYHNPFYNMLHHTLKCCSIIFILENNKIRKLISNGVR